MHSPGGSRGTAARVPALLTAVVALVTLAGCTAGADAPTGSGSGAGPGSASTSGAPSPTTAPTASTAAIDPATVHVELRQDRFSWGVRVLQLHVTSDGDAPLAVRRATLTVPTAEGTADSGDVVKDVPPGSYREVSVPLGAPVCAPGDGALPEGVAADGEDGPAAVAAAADLAARSRVELTVLVGDRTATVTVTPTDPTRHLPRILAEDCAAAAFARGASAAFGELRTEQRGSDLVAIVDLTVTPVPGGPTVAIDQVDQTLLLQPAPVGSGLSATAWTFPELAPVTGPVTVTLAARPGRCDPHAVAEDKRGTFLGLRTTVGGVPQHVFYVQLPVESRAGLKDYIGVACGWGSGG